MKRLHVNAYQVALVYKRGALREVFTEGSYWIGWGYKVVMKFMTLPLEDPAIELLLQHPKLKSMVDVIEVKDNQLALHFKRGIFDKVLTAGIYVYWKDVLDIETIIYNMDEVEVPKTVNRKLLQTYAIKSQTSTEVIESYEKGMLFIDGKFIKTIESGIFHYWRGAKIIKVLKADLRKQTIEVSGQELLTKDKANIRVNFQAQYQLVDIEKALIETKDVAKQLYTMLQLGLREYIGQLTLDELLANKSKAGKYVLEYANENAKAMGITLYNAGIKDIILPGEMKLIMNQVLIAEKKAQAQVIMRREETASTRSLMNTAKLMENNEMLYKLKEMEFVEKIAENINSLTLSGGEQVLDQLKTLFSNAK